MSNQSNITNDWYSYWNGYSGVYKSCFIVLSILYNSYRNLPYDLTRYLEKQYDIDLYQSVIRYKN